MGLEACCYIRVVATSEDSVRIRVSAAMKARWHEAAAERGMGLSDFVRAAVENEATTPTKPMVTKAGRVLTDADVQELADEAERGYDVEKLTERKPRAKRSTKTAAKKVAPAGDLSAGSEPDFKESQKKGAK